MALDASRRPVHTRSHVYTIGRDAVSILLHEPTAAVTDVPEALVQRLWAEQRFDAAGLQTTEGQPVTVLDPGTLNTDSGADFRDAGLRIGGMTWRGDVEIHTTSSGWFEHGHHEDSRYNSVVLHVTLSADNWTGGLLRADQSLLPEVVLLPHLQDALRALLRRHHTSEAPPILCAPQWPGVDPGLRRRWIQHLGRERLIAKRDQLAEQFAATPNLEALLYQRLFAGLGYAKNDAAMEDLARRLPLRLPRGLPSARDREALYLGAAGLIPAPGGLLGSDRATADYAMDLRTRYRRLTAQPAFRALGERGPMASERWTYFRLRPANFPPLRIAQGVAWFQASGLLAQDPVEVLAEAARAEDAIEALRTALAARPGAFWNNHLRLEKPSSPQDPQIGRSRIDTLIVNAVLPALLLRAQQTGAPALRERVLGLLGDLPVRRDSVTRRFSTLGTRPASALDAQGLHQLYRTYCTAGRCLSCAIGKEILGPTPDQGSDGSRADNGRADNGRVNEDRRSG